MNLKKQSLLREKVSRKHPPPSFDATCLQILASYILINIISFKEYGACRSNTDIDIFTLINFHSGETNVSDYVGKDEGCQTFMFDFFYMQEDQNS